MFATNDFENIDEGKIIQIQHESKEITDSAKKFVTIVSQEEFVAAAEELKRVKSAMKKIDLLFDESIKAAKNALDRVRDAKKKLRDPLEFLEANLKSKTTTFLRLEEENKRKQLIEMKRQEEQRAKEEAERIRKQQEEERLNTAAMLESQGFKEEAEEIMTAPEIKVFVPERAIKPVESEVKVEGIGLMKTYSGECYDIISLAKAVIAGHEQAQDLLLPNKVLINQRARALKGAFKVPGIKVVENVTTAARTK